jgi:glycosyltransferase involved in cell wall biosynthesis
MGTIRRLTVVMPVYNERVTLRSSLERLLKTELPVDIEVIVVDDGSVDSGIDTIADLVDDDRVRLLRHERNRGKSAALQTGIAAAAGDYLTVLDADLEYDPANLSLLLEPIAEQDATVVYGVRSFGSHTAYSFWYVVGNRMVSFWASLLFNAWVRDVETCLKVAPVDVWRSFNIRSKGFGIEAEVTAKLLRNKERIFEVPITYKARSREEGKKLSWRDGVQALWIILRVRVFGR